MADTIIDPLRIQAASDATWADDRIKVYNADGAAVPEPIRRLKTLADLALVHTPKPANPEAGEDRNRLNALIGQMREVLGAHEYETVEDAARRVVASVAEERSKARATAIQALRDVAGTVRGVADDLAALDAKTTSLNGVKIIHSVGTEVAMQDGKIVVTRPGSLAVAPTSPGGTDVEMVISPNGPSLAVTHEPGTSDRKREQIALSHGLVLLNLEQKHCAVITEPKEGQWFAQTILTDGKLSEPFGTNPGQWWTDKWEARSETITGTALHWKAAQKGEQQVIPGSGPLPGAPESAKKRIADWNPTGTDIDKFSASIGEALAKAGVSADTSPKSIMALVAKFKESKRDVEATNPGLSFYHWAVKALKGG